MASIRIGRPAQPEHPDVVRQSSLRSLNLAIVTQRVFGASEPLSRADVAADTGLTRSTVSRLVDDLIAGELIEETPPQAFGQRGRPAVPLVPAGKTWVALGLEVNVGRMAARLVDLAGHTRAEERVELDLRNSDPAWVIEELAALGRSVLSQAGTDVTLAGVQWAIPGLVDAERGTLLRAPNLGWWDVPARALLARALELDPSLIDVGNESDYAAQTVAWDAPGRPSRREEFLYLSGEIGIGSSLVKAGGVVTGGHGWAGEIGHVCVDRNGPVCACGARGCLEVYVGSSALHAWAGVPDTDTLLARIESRDARACDAVNEAAAILGVALAGALNLLDVANVVLGGHLGRLLPAMRSGIEAELRQRVVAAPFEAIGITAVPEERDMPSLGAAYTALHRVLEHPAQWLTLGEIPGVWR